MVSDKRKDVDRMISLVESASRRLEHSINDLQKTATSSSSLSLFSKNYPATYEPGVEMSFDIKKMSKPK